MNRKYKRILNADDDCTDRKCVAKNERQRNMNLIGSVQDTLRYDIVWYVTERCVMLLYDVMSHNDT